MKVIREYKDDIIKSQTETIQRLWKELGKRLEYEEQLLYVICQLEKYEKETDKQLDEKVKKALNNLYDKINGNWSPTELDEFAERQRGFEEFMKLDESEKGR